MAATLIAGAAPLTAASLRLELNARALAWAHAGNLRYDLTTGRAPSVIFGHTLEDAGQQPHNNHGNFDRAAYRAICGNPHWARRLGKAHTASVRALPRADWRWRELDAASSSDALLMNIFCHPETFHDGRLSSRIAALLGVEQDAAPRFGVRPRVPLSDSRADATEVDMELTSSGVGAKSLLVEAKLTESDFQTARPALVERYRDLDEVFDQCRLPRTRATPVSLAWDEEEAALVAIERGISGNYASYQLVRGTLAAHATGSAFCVLTDARRLDLVEAWHRVQQAVRSAELRCRLQLLTWQELAGVLPCSLQDFLAAKYGIHAA